MKIVELTEIKGGEKLAEAVYNSNRELLIPAGIELKIEYVDLLTHLGVRSVVIETEENDENKGIILGEKEFDEYTQAIKKLLQNHTYTGKNSLIKTGTIAEDIINSLDSSMAKRSSKIKIAKYDTNMYQHTMAVTVMSIAIAKCMNLKKEEIYDIALGCILHDLGIRYITVNYENRNMEDAEPAEVFEYKKHTILAYTVLENEKWLSKEARNIILSHHEKMNGKGFPLRQKNQDTICKIVQMVDSYHCMISGMECKKIDAEEAKNEILSKKGIEYDNKVVDTFFEIFE